MSKEVEKTILAECEHIARLVKAGEATLIPHYYYINDEGKKVYDFELMREQFDEEMTELEQIEHRSNNVI